MAISAATIWHVRVLGSDTLCAGCFDSTVAGAGTDYSDQDAAQLALTDLVSATPFTTITSATGGFTAAMIGNGIYIASGTGFTAGRYIITGVTNTNTAIIDRACAGSSASAGVAKLGGALASLISANFALGAYGNVFFVRGAGTNDPTDIDYILGNNVAVPSGVAVVGYNGRPKVTHNCYGFTAGQRVRFENLYFLAIAAQQTAFGAIFGGPSTAYNCVFDTGGWDAAQVSSSTSLSRCSFINTGLQSVATKPVCLSSGYNVYVEDCLFKDQRYTCISASMLAKISGCVFMNSAFEGVYLDNSSLSNAPMWSMTNNTFYNLGSNAARVAAQNINISGNVFYGNAASGAYAIKFVSTSPMAVNALAGCISRNDFYGNANDCNTPMAADNVFADPQFVSTSNLTPTNTALQILGGVGSL